MRKITSIIMIGVFITLLVLGMVKGIAIGKFEILSVAQLKQKNEELEQKIETASELRGNDYSNNIEILEKSFNQYLIQKRKYEELSKTTDEADESIYETKQYDISYLWTVLGKYAQKRDVMLGIDVQKNANAKNLYNLNFTITGEYTKVSQFITDIENDSEFYFRIYDFKMNAKLIKVEILENVLLNKGTKTKDKIITTSTFTVRNININPSTIK